MLAVRLHLDRCDRSNGALRVLPGTHLLGKLSGTQVEQEKDAGDEVFVEAEKGDVLLMRPLLLHASSPAENPDHRRVLHIEYTGIELPAPLDWRLGWAVNV
jgi:ectoine hydroxylase-related dioxygenase (phytanoyl-CoA dioxygenase family)